MVMTRKNRGGFIFSHLVGRSNTQQALVECGGAVGPQVQRRRLKHALEVRGPGGRGVRRPDEHLRRIAHALIRLRHAMSTTG